MITPFIDQTSIQALAWSLIHFLWQGAVLGLIAFMVLRLPRLRATTRYLAGVGTLLAMLVSPIATFIYLSRSVSEPAVAGLVEMREVPATPRAPTLKTESAVELRAPAVADDDMVDAVGLGIAQQLLGGMPDDDFAVRFHTAGRDCCRTGVTCCSPR